MRQELSIIKYSADKAPEWNGFIERSKNGTFLFHRSYMDYHADRLSDFSLMFYHKGRLAAVLPANRLGDRLYSHQGLSYGGLIMADGLKASTVCDFFTAMNDLLREEGITHVTYKPVPHIYCRYPSEEPLYALKLICQAQLTERDLASVVVRGDGALPMSELRRRGARKAERTGLTVRESDDLTTFWQLLEDNLAAKYHAHPVHTLEEITLLHSRFHDSIRLLSVYEQGQMTAGTVLYVTPKVIKTQYISASPRGKATGALDLLFTQLIRDNNRPQPYLDMGTSALADSEAGELNPTLISQKEGFGARAVCYDAYEWNT